MAMGHADFQVLKAYALFEMTNPESALMLWVEQLLSISIKI